MTRPSDPFAERYVYRRQLSGAELLPAVGVAIGVGALAFYLARIVLQRTPMRPDRAPALGEPAHFVQPRPAVRSALGTMLRSDSRA